MSWSPLGTFFATLHRQGVRLWGGSSWEAQQRFAHPFVKLIDFSPNENFLVTWSHDPIHVPEGAQQGPQYFSPEDEGNSIAVWDIKTGNLLRTFPSTTPESEDSSKRQMQWPAMKWSADDQFVGRVTLGQHISVYELPSMRLQDKKSIKIEGVFDFEWCPHGDKDREEAEKATAAGKKPKDNMLAYWTPEVANQPARVTVINFPGRSILRQKNLFNVTEVSPSCRCLGLSLKLLCSVSSTGKIKATSCVSRLIDTRRRKSPSSATLKSSVYARRTHLWRSLSLRVCAFGELWMVLSYCCNFTDAVTDFSWEPKGERFAIISSNDPNLGNPGPGVTIKTDVSFYQLVRGKGDFKLLRTSILISPGS